MDCAIGFRIDHFVHFFLFSTSREAIVFGDATYFLSEANNHAPRAEHLEVQLGKVMLVHKMNRNWKPLLEIG
jgi:hypothetical protein